MNYGQILSKAWKIIWKHKILWLFGILAGCSVTNNFGGGSGGGGGSAGNTGMTFSNQQVGNQVADFVTNVPVVVWIVIGLMIVVGIFVLAIAFFLAGVLGVSGVVKGTGLSLEQEHEEDTKPLSLKTIFNAVKPYYWRVLLLDLGYGVASFIIFFILFIPAILLTICTCGLIWLLAIPVGWFLHTMLLFTTIAIIEEDKGIFEGIARAWQVIIKNLGNVILMSLILGIGQLIVSIIIALPLLLTAVPVIINLSVTAGRAVGTGLIIGGVLFLILLPVVILLGGGLKAYVLTSWTLTYHRLINKEDLEPAVLSEEESDEEVK